MVSFFWRIVGVVLLSWVAWDLYAGYTLLYDVIYRTEDPLMYWIGIALWTALGLSCFFSSSRQE
ncbi:hypothetical protein PsAD13_05027 [Pseudovibrio sp. Ad13]|uniref:hypothetical protein n=1 Tax=unclassified Pseudovibrio TaxID=2627060 RepID=UPI0007AECE29|nr:MULTISPECIES: hypothetical protein [unclassified Pseudovibrio]KZK79681.1 hypothetical protein PsAD13_05027 [Pseudovibrio sp. Ad13]KZK94415.1 hypothetical protein PsW74_04660 [Pseudovibrio sp. W74]KZL04471.1 hypothetical protein PsAD14_05536 [Pseudovibrio sp. Ad14]